MSGNPNLNRTLRQAVYELKRDYGATVDVYKLDSASTDYRTGDKTASKSVITVRKAVVMPAMTSRKFFQGISYLSASKPFASQGGQGWDGTSRAFIFEGRDLPGYIWEVEDWIVYKNRRYDVSSIETLDDDTGWLIIGKEVKGAVPERIITENVVVDFNPTDEGQVIDTTTLSITYTGSVTKTAISQPHTFTFVGELAVASDGDIITIHLEETSGTIDLTFDIGTTTGLTFTTGDGVADTEVIFYGSLDDVNTALDSLSITIDAGSPDGSSAILATASTPGVSNDTAGWNIALIT